MQIVLSFCSAVRTLPVPSTTSFWTTLGLTRLGSGVVLVQSQDDDWIVPEEKKIDYTGLRIQDLSVYVGLSVFLALAGQDQE